MAICKTLREGILKVGAKRAGKLENETEHDEWFSSIGDAPMAELFRLYSKVEILKKMKIKFIHIQLFPGLSPLSGSTPVTNHSGC